MGRQLPCAFWKAGGPPPPTPLWGATGLCTHLTPCGDTSAVGLPGSAGGVETRKAWMRERERERERLRTTPCSLSDTPAILEPKQLNRARSRSLFLSLPGNLETLALCPDPSTRALPTCGGPSAPEHTHVRDTRTHKPRAQRATSHWLTGAARQGAQVEWALTFHIAGSPAPLPGALLPGACPRPRSLGTLLPAWAQPTRNRR